MKNLIRKLSGLFDTKRTEKSNGKFIGRYQKAHFVKQLLGENMTDMEMQIAINRDTGERNEIVEKVDELEKYLRSDFFTTQLDVGTAHKDIGKIIDKGYENCVLQNDRDLEVRCITILSDIIQYAKKLGYANGTMSQKQISEIDELIDLKSSAGFLTYWNLGGVLTTADEQQGWLIVSSLIQPNHRIGNFNPGNLISQFLATISKKDVESYSKQLRELRERLLKSGKIGEVESQKIDSMIGDGIKQNQEIHKKYPNRP